MNSILVRLCVVVSILTIYVAVMMAAWPHLRDKCIMERNPEVVVDGEIRYYDGIFTSSQSRYILFYQGKFERTGEICEVFRNVTKEEYERKMYRH